MYCALLNIMTADICASQPTYQSVWTQMAGQQKELITGASTAKKTIKFGLSSYASQQHFLCHHMIWQTRDYYSTWLVPYFQPLRYPLPLLQNCLQLSLSTWRHSCHEMCNEAFVSAYVSVYVRRVCVYTLHTVNTCMGALQSFNKWSQSGGKLPWIMMIFQRKTQDNGALTHEITASFLISGIAAAHKDKLHNGSHNFKSACLMLFKLIRHHVTKSEFPFSPRC